jgi:predicted metal-dependent enzyme (double-stranded beta helix superfamily)
MTAYSMSEFIANVCAVKAEDLPPGPTLDKIAPLARRIAGEDDWLEERFRQYDPEQGMGINVLHGDSNGPMISTVCWRPGFTVLPHDHQTWACIVGIEGVERNIGWRRLDDGRRAGYAELKNAGEIVLRHGIVCTLLPYDIHSVRNEGETPSLSLHIYGHNLGRVERNEFVPEENIVRPCPQRKRND